jgi:hypothetical protein
MMNKSARAIPEKKVKKSRNIHTHTHGTGSDE